MFGATDLRADSLPLGLLEAIVAVESNGNPMAYNKRTGDYGLYQINYRTAVAYGYKPADMYKPHIGRKVAVKLLVDIRKRFGHEKLWPCRYNVGWRLKAGTSRACIIYYNKLLKAGYNPQNKGDSSGPEVKLASEQ